MSCLYGRKKGEIHLDEKSPSSDLDLHDRDVEIKIDCPPGIDGDTDADEMRRRLEKLRSEILDAKLEWYVVPSEDEHQSEEVGDSDKRREYISGFTGSAGTAVVPSSFTKGKAKLFVDSRYWIQAEQQVLPDVWHVRRMGGGGPYPPPTQGWVDWLVKEVDDGARVGIDPKLVSYSLIQYIRTQLADRASATQLIPISTNLVDRTHTPSPRSTGPLIPHPMSFAGETASSKLDRVRESLSQRRDGPDWIYFLPTLPAIAWLLNIRCPTDIPFCPVPYAYLGLTQDACVLFVDGKKVEDGSEVQNELKEAGVDVRDYGVDEVGKWVKETLGKMKERGNDKKKVIKLWAPNECSWALSKACEDAKIDIIPCPVEPLKGIKNPVEQQGYRNAYLRDGRAMVRWMSWLEQTLVVGQRKVGEWAAAQTLTRFRREEEHFAGLAYDDISASGPNGALPHYAPKRGKDSIIDLDATYVIDSGAQYLDGTIDTTRTLYLGNDPAPEVKRAYTRVLQGHIAVSVAEFPEGMSSDWFNMLARQPLYADRLDFGHGLGHGVGSYLAVHEYPSPFPHGVSFKPGHVTTVEPGYYREGEWGIRTESVVLCKELEGQPEEGTKKWLGWERITQVPIQTSLVDWSIMSKPEIKWLNEHNTSIQEALLPLLQEDRDAQVRDWLKRACKPHRIWPWTGV